MESITQNDYSNRVSIEISDPMLKTVVNTLNMVMGYLEKSDRELNDLIKELSTPAMEISNSVVVMPLVGRLTSDRTLDAMNVLLKKIEETKAEVAIIDITGVPSIDSVVAEHLIRLTSNVKLMGAEPVITGISANAVLNLSRMSIKFDFATKSTLSKGLSYAKKFLSEK